MRTHLRSGSAAFTDDWKKWTAFQSHYDDWTLDKLEAFARYALELQNCRVEKVPVKGSGERRKRERLSRDLDRIEQLYADYRALVPGFGEPEDYRRVIAYESLHKASRELTRHILEAERIVSLPGIDPDGPQNLQFHALRNGDAALRGLGTLSSLVFRAKSGPGKTPAVDQALGMLRAEAGDEGLSIQLIGDLPDHRRPDPNEVTLYAHNHLHAFYDFAALSKLSKRGIGIIGNLYLGFPKIIAELGGKLDHLIGVGKDDVAAANKAVTLARSGKLSAYMVATQASASTGFYDDRPNSHKTEDLLLSTLKRAGIRVRTVAVALPDSFRLMNLWRSTLELPSSKTLRVILTEPIEDEELDLLNRSTGDRYAHGKMIRALWQENYDSTGDRFMSAPSLREQERLLELYALGRPAREWEQGCLSRARSALRSVVRE